jgi:hypothetical protein
MTITSISPASGAPGVALTITGTALPLAGQVRFSGAGKVQLVTPYLATATEIRALVPACDGVGGVLSVDVVDGDGSASNAVAFTLDAVPADDYVYPLCSLGMVKTLLGIPAEDTGMDEQLTALIRAASARIAGECRREFRLVDHVDELRDGDGSAMLVLAHTPIVSIASLEIGGQAVDRATVKVYENWIAFDDWEEYDIRLRASSRVFPRGSQNVKISYRSGYAAVPTEISVACVLQVVHIRNTVNKQGIESETNSVANAATVYSQVGIAPAAIRAINRYRKPRAAVV